MRRDTMRKFKVWLSAKLLRLVDRWMKSMTYDEQLDVALRRKRVDTEKWKKMALTPLGGWNMRDIPDQNRLGEKDLVGQDRLKVGDDGRTLDGPWSNSRKN